MFGNNDGKPVDIVITEHTYIDGELQLAGTTLEAVPVALAMELAGAGKARLATPAAKAAGKAAKAAAGAEATV